MMPAVLPPTESHYVVFRDMPFVRNLSGGQTSYLLEGYGESPKAAKEAEYAILRFIKNSFSIDQRVLPPAQGRSFMLDPVSALDDLRAFAMAQGVDFDELVAGASSHFGSPQVVRRTEPLSQEELGCLFDDDQRSLSGL